MAPGCCCSCCWIAASNTKGAGYSAAAAPCRFVKRKRVVCIKAEEKATLNNESLPLMLGGSAAHRQQSDRCARAKEKKKLFQMKTFSDDYRLTTFGPIATTATASLLLPPRPRCWLMISGFSDRQIGKSRSHYSSSAATAAIRMS